MAQVVAFAADPISGALEGPLSIDLSVADTNDARRWDFEYVVDFLHECIRIPLGSSAAVGGHVSLKVSASIGLMLAVKASVAPFLEINKRANPVLPVRPFGSHLREQAKGIDVGGIRPGALDNSAVVVARPEGSSAAGPEEIRIVATVTRDGGGGGLVRTLHSPLG